MNIKFILILLCTNMKLSQGVVREFYVAAEEIGWDYLHGENLESKSGLRSQSLSKDGFQLYTKAVYREYTDSTFSALKAKPPWTGIQGPTIRAEINDKVVVHFKNFASQPYSIYPVGISYWKQSEGAGYDDATSRQEKEDDAVAPGGYYRYAWDIQPANGPTTTDPNCLTYSYSSQVDIVRDFNSGLVGALLVCKAGSLGSEGLQAAPEYILLFAVFDESKSWYGESGMSRERFKMSRVNKKYHTINGYVNSTLPGLKMCKKDSVFWHLIGMGSSSEIHSILFQEHTLEVMSHRKVLLEVTPMTFATAEMKPVCAGQFLISCQIHSHQQAGMNAHFTVENCPEPVEPLGKRSAIHTKDYEYDLALEDIVSSVMVYPGLNARSSVKLKPKLWVHYIAAEEIVWDYAPELGKRDRTSDYIVRGPQRIGKEYKKAVYVEYTDASFTQRKSPSVSLVGPVLRGEVEDKLKIVFKNLASVPFNIYPNGLTNISAYGKQEMGKALRSYAVMPNETFAYLWVITPEDGPTKADPRCLTRLYQSTVNPVRDLASGLVGPLVVCYRKTLDKRGNVLMSDKEKHLLFTVFDENKSWYMDENIKKYSQDLSNVDPTDPEFYNSNVMYNVNGFMYNNVHFTACLGDVTFWHVLNVGTQSDFLSVYFMGNTFERDKVYETVLTLFPMNGETVSMEMETVGEWEISAFDSNSKKRGMSARYTVKDCDRNLPLFDEEDYIEDYIERNIARSTGPKNRSLAVKVCKRPISNSTTGNHNAAGPGEPVCIIKYITFNTESNEGAFAEGDIPEDILLELEKQSNGNILRNGSQTHVTPGIVEPGGPETITPELGTATEKPCGVMCVRRHEKRSASFLALVSGRSALSDVPTTGGTNVGKGEMGASGRPVLDTARPALAEPDGEGYTNLEEVTTGGFFTKRHQLPISASMTNLPPQGLPDSTGQDPDAKPHGRLWRREGRRKTTRGPEPEKGTQDDNQIVEQDYAAPDDEHLELDIQTVVTNKSNSTWSEPVSDYDEYSNEGSEAGESLNASLDLRSTEGKYRSYYIAAEEIMWDYGLKKPQQLMNLKEMRKGVRKFLAKYKKVVFRAYLDQEFKYPATRGEMEEHLGIMGPVIKTEINDILTVTFKNLASRPFSFHLHGIFDKSQAATIEEVSGEEVQPNEVRVYRWKITKRQGPSAKEFDCKAWTYYSNLDMERDVNSGLVGPLIVCKPGTLHPTHNLDLNVQEFFLLFTIFDETKSWYFEENMNRFCTPPCQFNKNDPWFKIGNRFPAINGHVAETLPGLLVAQHQRTRWHLLNMGASGEFHAVHFHGLPFTVRSDQEHRLGIYKLYPGVFGTVEMRPAMAGTWMVECSIGEHQLAGMRATLLVYNLGCAQPLGMRTGRITDSQITDSGHHGDWEARLARLELSGSINAWSGFNKMSWIQVDLKRPMLVHEIRTQGATHGFSESFIVLFNISYSLDGVLWKTYKGTSSKAAMIFNGNMDGSKIRQNFFSPPLLGRYIRVNPVDFKNSPTLRMELFGCDLNSCSSPMGMEKMLIPNQSISASSFLHKVFLTWSPSLARLNLEGSANAWRPKTNNPYEWIQVDFKVVKRVTGVVTQGARSFLTHMMVTEFTVFTSNNGHIWNTVLDEDTKREKVFQGNSKYDEEALNVFEPPLFTRYMRIQPRGWYNDIALRIEFLGCDTQQ